MKNAILIVLSLAVGHMSGAVFYHNIGNGKLPQSSKSTIYTVKCIDDILEGEFVKVNDKYFRPDATGPTWIPLSQCGLEPKGEE